MDLTLAICVYNAEKYLAETLESVISQTRQDFHLLIVDDCSTDNSVEIIKHFFEKYPRRYKLITLHENHGIGYVRDLALNESATRYIVFIDADDLLVCTLVEKMYDKIVSDPNIMGVTCYSQFIDTSGNKIFGGTYLGVKSKSEFMGKAKMGKLFFMPIHTIFDRQAAIKVGGFCTSGFPNGKPRFQDYCEELDLWTRMSDLYSSDRYFITLPEILYYYRKSDGLSSNHFNMLIKMRYTKTNVRRRRRGESNLTFCEFYDSLDDKTLESLKKEAFAADSLRNGVILCKRGNMLKGGWLILRSFFAKPSYFLDKIKHNLRLSND